MKDSFLTPYVWLTEIKINSFPFFFHKNGLSSKIKRPFVVNTTTKTKYFLFVIREILLFTIRFSIYREMQK